MGKRSELVRDMTKPSGTVPTLDDVAKRAGVSTATVSRCLNDPDRVVPATRDRVMAAVDALGYTPNFAAQVMAAKKTKTIGAIVPTMENAIFARALQAFQDELKDQGYTLLVSSSAYDPDIEFQQIRSLAARGADGLLLIGHARAPEVYAFLENRSLPTIIAWSYQDNARLPCVGFDNKLAMARMAEQVFSQGHRRVAMISGVTKGNDRATPRVAGFKEVASSYGLSADDLMIVEQPYTVEGGQAAFDVIWAADPRPTAIICGNDVLAAGTLLQARSHGVRVPEDLSITGFDNLEFAQVVNPQLTTVHVPHRIMGRLAAQEIINMVEHGKPGASHALDTRLVLRDSLKPV